MALEDDATNGGNGTPPSNEVGSLPTNSPATPPIPVQPSAATKPAEAPAQPPALPLSPAAPSRSFMGALAHALIGSTMAVATGSIKAAAGPPAPDSYSTDASGKVTPNYSRRDDTRSRLERLAQHALEGLAAGAAIGPQKSKAAGFAAGLGAGVEALRQQGQQQDLLKRQQAREDYDEQQKAMVHKATIAMTNATTHSTWQKFADDENAKDTERQKNAGIVSALNEYTAQNPDSKLTVQTLTAEQAMAMRESDAHTAAKHTFLPVGIVQAKDANGNDVFEADGVTPKFIRQFAAIGGSADEKVVLPQVMADDIRKFSKFDPRLKSAAQLTPGQDLSLASFLSAYKFLTEDKGKEADGGREGEPVSVNGKLQKRNKYTGEISEYAGGVPLAVQKEQADIAEKEAGAFEKTELGKKAKKDADAEGLFNPAASSGLSGDDYLRTLPPAAQNVLKAIAEGRET